MILVIGATGYIGRYFCTEMVRQGEDILALGRSAKVQQFLKSKMFHSSILILMIQSALRNCRRITLKLLLTCQHAWQNWRHLLNVF